MMKIALLLAALSSFAACATGPTQGDDSGNGGGNGGGGGRPADDGDDDGDDGDGGGSGGGGGTGGGGDASALDDINSAECEAALACEESWNPEYGDFSEYYGTDQNSCEAAGAEYYGLDAIAAAIADGTIEVDTAAAAECSQAVAALGAPDCGTFFENGLDLPEACGAFLIGTVAAGGQCQLNEECESAFCGEAGTCEE